MNIFFSTTYIILVTVFFNQLSFGMEKVQVLVPCLSALLPETQRIIFRYLDNKTNLQQTSKALYIRGSIKSPTIFYKDLCGVDSQRMVRILLHAAYVQNHEGVENILKKSTILQDAKNCLFYHYIDINSDSKKMLDLYGIADHNNDEKMKQLLKEYKIPILSEQERLMPTELVMACIAGSSDVVESKWNDNINNIENAFKISIDYDHGKCVKALLKDSGGFLIGDIIVHTSYREQLLTKKNLWQVCFKKKLKVLQELLAINYFSLNDEGYFPEDDNEDDNFVTSFTLLDKILEKSKKDPEYNAVASVLKYYGAKTAIDVEEEEKDAKDAVPFPLLSCIIS